MIGVHIGIDFGSSVTKIYQEGKGVVFAEPTIAVCDVHTGKPVAFGAEAAYMLGRTPGALKVVYPVNNGAIDNFDIARYLLSYYIDKICSGRLFKPNVIVSIHGGLTSLERRTVLDVMSDMDVARAFLMEEPLAAAIGAGVPFDRPGGAVIADIGGGTADSAVVTMGSIALSKSIKTAGIALTDTIRQHVLRLHNMEIGFHSAQEIKHTIGGTIAHEPELAFVTNGKNSKTGIPLSFEVTSTEIFLAMKEQVSLILDSIHSLIEETPPEFMPDIMRDGILLTGGSANLYGLDTCIRRRLGITAKIAPAPQHCVVNGLGKALKDMERLFKSGYLFDFESV